MKLPHLFSKGMVIQRDLPVKVWGWCEPGETVSVSLADRSATAVAGSDGKFLAVLPPFSAGGPFEMTVSGKTTINIPDVLIGEVWLASGQSNMEWPLNRARDGEAEIAAADDPFLRHCFIPRTAAVEPQTDVSASWQSATPETAGGFSAVAYFFARVLRDRLDIPVGIINASWGGTTAEAWTSRPGLAAEPSLRHFTNAYDSLVGQDAKSKMDAYQAARLKWMKLLPQDVENKGLASGWAETGYDDKDWGFMSLPVYWAQTGLLVHGICWFRREVNVPESWTGQDLLLKLGALDKSDQTYFNGVQVGSLTWDECEESWATDRNYTVPARLVRPGRNVVSIRIMSVFTGGGSAGPVMELTAPNLRSDNSLPLNGPWRYRIEANYGTVTPPPGRPAQPGGSSAPAGLFNGMIAPLVPFAIRGAIWYQGESNASRAKEYRTLFPALIKDWRRHWGFDFQFYFVQLANYGSGNKSFTDSRWAELRDAQASALSLPNTGMAVTIDIGDPIDIHPKNKQDVGLRLALNALAVVHSQTVDPIGPRLRSCRRKGNCLHLSFDHAKGLHARGGAPLQFGIAGKDLAFRQAKAVISGRTVILSNPSIPAPKAARYGWADSPVCNVFNAAGLPMEPFRTDAEPAN